MSQWPQVLLSQVCTQDRRHAPDATTLPYVGLEHVTSGTGEIILNDVDKGEPSGTAFAFDERHVLYGKLRPYLNKVALPSFPGRCSMELIPLLPKASLERGYLAAFLRHPKTVADATARNTGSRMPRADMQLLLKSILPLPPLDEQRRIVDLLNRAAGIRRLRKQALAKARETIPALFLSMFGDPATNPKGWPVVQFGDVIASGPQNGLYRPASDYGDGVRILRIDSFDDGAVADLAALKRLRIDSASIARYGLVPGDLVINRVNSPPQLGKSVLVPALDEPVVFESNMMRLRLDEDRLRPEAAIVMLQLPSARRQLTRNAKHAINQSSINQGDVLAVRFSLPPLDLQQRFADRLANLHSIIVQQEQALVVTRDLERSLMAQLLA